MNGGSVAERSAAARGVILLVPRRNVDDAGDHLAAGLETDQHGPQGAAAREVARAVDWIDDPAPAALGGPSRSLFSEKSILGKRLREYGRNQLLRFPVRDGDRRFISFGLGRYSFTLVAQGQFSRAFGGDTSDG